MTWGNYAPKLASIAISDPAAVQDVTLENPTPQGNPFGPGIIDFACAPDFRAGQDHPAQNVQ
jgi:hypothetical protein